jgi:hypothetical protein
LDSQLHLKHIALYDVNGFQDIAMMISKHPNPAALTLIEIVGWYEDIEDGEWQVLDRCLSRPCFACKTGERTLTIRQADNLKRPDEKIDEGNFPQIRELG